MIYLLLILASIVLFAGFLGLTVVEARTGTRVLAAPRAKLDRKVAQAAFIITHVNWSEFAWHLIQSSLERVIHDAAHWALIAVRFAERQLTKVVRYLRDRRPNLLAPKPSRTPILEQTANYFKSLRLRARKAKDEE